MKGRKLFNKYDRGEDNFVINKDEIMEVQKQSKDELEMHTSKRNEMVPSVTTHKNIEMNRDAFIL